MGKIMLNEIDYSGGNANVIRLTQAEYDALPPSKLTDNNVYMITDVNGDGSQFQPVIYSEDEREIGVWVDGKPLYEKTFYLASGSLSTGTLDVPNDLTNIDRVVGYSGVVHSDSEDRDFKLPYTRVQYDESIFILNMVLIDDTVAISIISGDHSSYNQLSNIYVTLQYTKTTDTAGSGTWTPQGVPAVHYSTDEQVVGTWIDGSTVYEKTYSGSLTSGDIVLEHFENKMPVESSGWLKNGNGYGIILGAFIQNSQNWWSALHINPNNDLVIIHGSELNSGNYYITVKYIKSSQGGN